MPVAATITPPAPGLAPLSLRDVPSFIERQFPVGRLSAEAYKERKAGAGQTLTALGSYWKGRKPLILVRAVVLGSLLPASDDAAIDLEIFLKLVAMDDAAFGRRFDDGPTKFAALFPNYAETVATNRAREWLRDLPEQERTARVNRVLACVAVEERERLAEALAGFVTAQYRKTWVTAAEFARRFPASADELTEETVTRWRWRDDLEEEERQERIAEAFASLPYAERLKHVRRPEECDEAELLGPIWPAVNLHLGTTARNLSELVEQLGAARYGHRPNVADTFCGGGSIPFEAARVGCDVYASDLNPIACMLTWGAFNIIGASKEDRAKIEAAQKKVAADLDAEITRLAIEHDRYGNRAKAFLYCLETRCPRTGWMVPMSGSWVVSKQRNVVAKLIPDHAAKRYEIEIRSGVTAQEMAEAEQGTVREGRLVHPMNPEPSGVEIRTIRGDYRDDNGESRNRLRLWEKSDFMPRPDDIFLERLYCVQWITKETFGKGRQETFFASATEDDLARERKVQAIVRQNLETWQNEGLVAEMPIERGEKTEEPIRTRGWTYWHHLFSPRDLLFFALLGAPRSPLNAILLAKLADRTTKLCGWVTTKNREAPNNVFADQALTPQTDYCIYSASELNRLASDVVRSTGLVHGSLGIAPHPTSKLIQKSDLFVTDPPYADAVVYHEITEFFIAWLRKNPPSPFDQWTWDSQRNLAIKGKDEQFRRDMVAAYATMTRHMPDNGMQVVMFTHQDAGVWADLGSILWAAGLSVTAAWNVVTEAESALKEGNYVQGTVCLVLRKRLGEANARRMEIEAEIEEAVAAQLARLTALDDSWHERANAESLYTDGDLTLAAYAAALQVVTAYSTIDRQPLDRDLYRKLAKGETTMLRELIGYAESVANNLLVPEGFPREMWRDLTTPERFYVRMLDMEAEGSAKVADFQNFAKSFAFSEYAELMGSTAANAASLAGAAHLKGRMLADHKEASEGFAASQLRQVLFAIWKAMEGGALDPKRGVTILKTEYAADYWQRRQKLIALSEYVALKTKRTRSSESEAGHELAEALKLDRV